MDIFGILDADPDPHENLCRLETLDWGGRKVDEYNFWSKILMFRIRIQMMPDQNQAFHLSTGESNMVTK